MFGFISDTYSLVAVTVHLIVSYHHLRKYTLFRGQAIIATKRHMLLTRSWLV